MLLTLLFVGSMALSLAGLAVAIVLLRRSAKSLREVSALAAERAEALDYQQKASRASSLESRAAWVEASAALSEAQLIRWLDASPPAKDAMLKVEVRLFRAMRYLETQLAREPSAPMHPEITLEPLTTADAQDAKLILLRSSPARLRSRATVRIEATRAALPMLAKAP